MPQICTGCGLTTDIEGKLIVNTGGSVWPFACPETEGSPLYCGADGVLRGAPVPVARTIILNPPTVEFGSGVLLVPSPAQDFLTFSFDAVNPSTCLPAIVDYAVEFEVSVDMDDDARFRVFFNTNRYSDFTAQGGDMTGIGWQLTATTVFTLAAGATSTRNVNVSVDRIGTPDVFLRRIECRIRGTIIAMQDA